MAERGLRQRQRKGQYLRAREGRALRHALRSTAMSPLPRSRWRPAADSMAPAAWSPPRSMARLRALAALAFAALAVASSRPQDRPDALRLFVDGKYDDARRPASRRSSADPANIESYVVLSWSLVALGRYADAENYALKGYAIRRDPRLTETLGRDRLLPRAQRCGPAEFPELRRRGQRGREGRDGLLLHGRDIPSPRALQPRRYRLLDGASILARQRQVVGQRPATPAKNTATRCTRSKPTSKALSIDPHLQDAADGFSRVSAQAALKMPLRVAFHTLGCKLNQLRDRILSPTPLPGRRHGPAARLRRRQRATSSVVNTCTVTGKAEQKARRIVRRALADNPSAAALVTGCYAQVERRPSPLSTNAFSSCRAAAKEALLGLPGWLGAQR